MYGFSLPCFLGCNQFFFSFQQRLKRWEQRERQKQKSYQREKDLETDRVRTIEKNKQRLLAYLEDPRSNKEDEYYIDR